MGLKVSGSVDADMVVEYEPVGRNECNLKGM